jgi:hypothetical protein
MSFFGSKKRRQQSYVPKYETDVSNQKSSREVKQTTMRTTPEPSGFDYLTPGGKVTDQN